MRELLDHIEVLCCRLFHGPITKPTGTYYTCVECGRRYKVPWAVHTEAGVYEQQAEG